MAGEGKAVPVCVSLRAKGTAVAPRTGTQAVHTEGGESPDRDRGFHPEAGCSTVGAPSSVWVGGAAPQGTSVLLGTPDLCLWLYSSLQALLAPFYRIPWPIPS